MYITTLKAGSFVFSILLVLLVFNDVHKYSSNAPGHTIHTHTIQTAQEH